MRWAFDPRNGSLQVYDHAGRTVVDAADYELEPWSDVPRPVKRIMLDAARQAIQNGSPEYAAVTVACMAAEEVVEGDVTDTENIDVASSDDALSIQLDFSSNLGGLL